MIQVDCRALERFREAVMSASARSDVRDAVHNIYRALQDQIDLRRPLCSTSGRCCRFDEFGHNLFVTTMELATFMHDFRSKSAACGFTNQPVSATTTRGCPFQLANLCSVHTIRPFGCRVFFCDQTATDWQQRQYEYFHAELKRLHERLEVPYFYLEWRQVLRVLFPIQTL